MLYPSINEIRKKADSRYTIVILAAKRARHNRRKAYSYGRGY